MKIMFINNNSNIIYSLSQTALFCGYKSILYNFNKPIHEVGNKFTPNMIISNVVNNDIIKYLKHNRDIMSVFVTSNEEEIQHIKNNLFLTKISIPQFAANIFDGHYPYTKDKRFVLCGNIRKTKETEEILRPFLSVSHDIRIKLFSDDNWPTEYYCGKITEQDFNTISNLSWFTIHIGEENQSLYNSAACNSCILSNQELKIPTTVFKNYNELIELIKYYNNNPHAYDIAVNNTYMSVMKHSTYFHRLADIFNYFNINNNIVNKLEELL